MTRSSPHDTCGSCACCEPKASARCGCTNRPRQPVRERFLPRTQGPGCEEPMWERQHSKHTNLRCAYRNRGDSSMYVCTRIAPSSEGRAAARAKYRQEVRKWPSITHAAPAVYTLPSSQKLARREMRVPRPASAAHEGGAQNGMTGRGRGRGRETINTEHGGMVHQKRWKTREASLLCPYITSHIHARTCIYTCTHAHLHTHTYTHARVTHAHTRTYTLSHTHVANKPLPSPSPTCTQRELYAGPPAQATQSLSATRTQAARTRQPGRSTHQANTPTGG